MGKGDAEGGCPSCATLFVWVASSLPVYGKWRGTEHPRYLQCPESLLLGSGGNPGPKATTPSLSFSLPGLRIGVEGAEGGR